MFSSRKPSAPRAGVRPRLEELEQRQVPTVTYHGGALLPHVEVQALYYGSDWSTNATDYRQDRNPAPHQMQTAGNGLQPATDVRQ